MIEFGDGLENDIFAKNNGIAVDHDMIMTYIENMSILLTKTSTTRFFWEKKNEVENRDGKRFVHD